MTKNPPNPSCAAIRSSRASGVTEYCGKLWWNLRAFATFSSAMTDSSRSSPFGIRFAAHLICSMLCSPPVKTVFRGKYDFCS